MDLTPELKVTVFELCQAQLEARISSLTGELEQLSESAASDTKSSAGDKYETGREMVQLERDKIQASLADSLKLQRFLSQLDVQSLSKKVEAGSLVSTNHGLFFLGLALGNINGDSLSFYAISMASPIGLVMKGREVGDTFRVGPRDYEIEGII